MEKPTAAEIDNAIDVLARARLTGFASFTNELAIGYYKLNEKRGLGPLEEQRRRVLARLLGLSAVSAPELGISLMRDEGWS